VSVTEILEGYEWSDRAFEILFLPLDSSLRQPEKVRAASAKMHIRPCARVQLSKQDARKLITAWTAGV
jgi:hypothetical protein